MAAVGTTEGSQTALLDVKKVAGRLQLSERAVYNLLKRHELPGTKIGKSWFVPAEALEQLLQGGLPVARRWQAPVRGPARPDVARVGAALQAVDENLQHIKDTLASAGALLNGAFDNGLEAILPPRRASAATEEAIKSLIHEAKGEILLSGVSLRQFFHDRPFRASLWERLAEGPPIRIRVLLIDPLSHAARARMCAEEPAEVQGWAGEPSERIRKSILFQDLQRSVQTITRFQAQLKDPEKIAAQFYDHTPFAFFILADRGMIIEQYHFGRESSPAGGCIGELVPLFRFSPESDYYKVMKSSFEYIWAGENPLLPLKTLDQISQELVKFEASVIRGATPPARQAREKGARPRAGAK
jgi:excisionase family DNA binding protein